MLSRASGKQGWVLKQGLNHAKSRIRDAWKRWVLQQGLNYVEARIREAAAQVHAESPPRPKTYSWTAAFGLRASFAVSKAGVGAQARAKSCKVAHQGRMEEVGAEAGSTLR